MNRCHLNGLGIVTGFVFRGVRDRGFRGLECAIEVARSGVKRPGRALVLLVSPPHRGSRV